MAASRGLDREIDNIDALNARFYSRFPYPWHPMVIPRPLDPALERRLIGQAIGDWSGDWLPERAAIWVAGCGTNQAVLTALRFPSATVVGSDVSPGSLGCAADLAHRLELHNLELREESINSVRYRGEFDYVVCTGVIHHNARPDLVLERLAAALRTDGLLELMVYHREHWNAAIAFQRAVQLVTGASTAGDAFEADLEAARHLLGQSQVGERLREICIDIEQSEAALADALIQPLAYSYDLDGLLSLASGAGLDVVAPCASVFDRARGGPTWSLTLEDGEFRDRYERMPDHARWRIADLIQLERAPMLWFYLQRGDCDRPILTEAALNQQFLERRFRPLDETMRLYVRQEDGGYVASRSLPRAASHRDPRCGAALEALREAPERTVGELWPRLGAARDLATVSRVRTQLTTPAYPHLLAVLS